MGLFCSTSNVDFKLKEYPAYIATILICTFFLWYAFTGKFMGEKEVAFSITNLSDREFDLVVKTESLDASEPILVNLKPGANINRPIKLITMHFKGNRITILDSNEEFDLNNKTLNQIPIRVKRVYCYISYNYDMKIYELDWNY